MSRYLNDSTTFNCPTTNECPFYQDLSPCLTKVSREVDYREKELTHQVHRVILSRSLESIKTLAPILICAMKIYVQLVDQRKKTDEAAENRNYLARRMTDEINEIIRVLQLTTYDEDEWESDDVNRIKKTYVSICRRRGFLLVLKTYFRMHFKENWRQPTTGWRTQQQSPAAWEKSRCALFWRMLDESPIWHWPMTERPSGRWPVTLAPWSTLWWS